jgi:hypothetical protein
LGEQGYSWLPGKRISDESSCSEAPGQGQLVCSPGFNRQKNSGFNLEHLYSKDPENLKAYYYLLQIAHIIMLLLEHGKHLRRLAQEWGKTPVQWLGSLQNIARRLLESLRNHFWPEQVEEAPAAAPAVRDTS